MRIAAKVRLEKEQHPERFCTDARCLWRVQHPGRPDTPCPKHPTKRVSPPSELESRGQPSLVDRHEFGCTAYVGRPCICPQLRKARTRYQVLHSAHRIPVPGCLDCEDLLAEARGLMDEGWAE